MQHLACDSLLEQDKERPDDGWLFNVETEEPVCDPENSNIDWEFLATSPLSLASSMESPHPGAQHNHSLSENHSESQGSLLQFDRKAPGRISTSPTLRRLRASGLGTPHSLAQQNALEVSALGSSTDLTGSSHCLSKNLSGSPEDSSHSMSSLRPHSKLSLDNRRAFDTNEAVESQARTPNEDTLPVLQATSERSLHQASTPGPQGPTSLSSTPGSREPQGEESHQSRFYEHRRSSVVLNLPGLEVFPGDLLVSDGAADYLCHPLLLLNPESKKTRWPFSKRGVEPTGGAEAAFEIPSLMVFKQSKGKHKNMSDLEGCLASVRITDFAGYEFCSLKDKTWREIMEEHQKVTTDQLDLRKQQEAMWELFTSECTYFLDHLLVLKMIFMNTLRYLQIHEYLLEVDSWRLFSNLEELTQTSLGFVNSLFGIIKDYVNASETSPLTDFVSVLTQYFQGSLCQSHQTYCLNYSAALFYLESLRQREDFNIYLKWCEQNEQCRRLRLPELLVAPLHRLTRYPLLLKNIWKRSTDSTEKISLYAIKEKVEKSIWELEGKVKWLDNFQKLRHLQEIIVWPPLWDRDKRFFIPEGLKHIFKEHMTENILSPTNRHLLYEGRLTLAESTRFLDVYLFLFDDFLLVTKTKRNKKKPGGSDTSLMCPSLTPELQTLIKEGGSCVVLDQPIPLDRLVVRSIDAPHVSVFGLKNTFLIQHENRYRQCTAAFLLQAQTENIKKTWMAQITTAIAGFTKSQETKKASLFTLSTESSEI